MFSLDDPEAASSIYSTNHIFRKSKWYYTFQQPHQTNTFATQDNKLAAEGRRKFKPAYDSVLIYESAIEECCDLLQQKLTDLSKSGETVDLGQWLTCYAFDVNAIVTV